MCEYFNGTTSQAISSVENSEIGSGVSPSNRTETKAASFVRGNNRFSLFKWLKRGNRTSSTIGKRRKKVSSKSTNFEEENLSSSTESVSTFYSTTTVHSFAFQAGVFQECNDLNLNFPQQLSVDIGPFGSGAVKLLEKTGNNLANVNYTLPSTFLQKRDITERYSLQPSNSFNSCGNIPAPENKWCNSLKGKKVHVKGKRRAPNPPASNSNARQSSFKTKRRTKRQAPPPPDDTNLKGKKTIKTNSYISNDKEISPTISNDTLILRGGILLPKNSSDSNSTEEAIFDAEIVKGKESQSSTLVQSFDRAMPRPWYKRSVFDSNTASKKDIYPSSTSSEKREDCASSVTYFPFDGSLSKLNFFHRTDRNSEDRRDKRKSGISILTNISELDKEAAAIVQEEQARAKVSSFLQNNNISDLKVDKSTDNEDFVPSSPRKSTRALISKFNAITNLSKVTVNTNYFSKNSPTTQRVDLSDRIQNQSKNSSLSDIGSSEQKNKVERRFEQKQDLSRYFISHQKSPKLKQNSKNKTRLNKNDTQEKIVEKIQKREETKVEKQENFTTERRLNSIENGLPDTKNASSFNKNSFNKQIFQADNPPLIIIRELDLIFNEIDKQLENNIKKGKINNSRNEAKASTSNQTDFLSEIETSQKTTSVKQLLNKSETEKISKSIDLQKTDEVTTKNLSTPHTQDAPVTIDLKEILKEMKHSLPKRSKGKKIIQNHSEIPNVNNKSSTSTFNDLNAFTTTNTNLKEDILEKPSTQLLRQEKFVTEVREEKKLKVSSAAQTSGNVKKVINFPSTSKQNMNQIFTNKRGECGTATKYKLNKFHLIRPKEFDEIEAIKLVKTPWLENIYANVTQQPSCSNKIILPLRPVINVQPAELLLKRKEEVEKSKPLSAKFNQQEILILPGNNRQQRNFNDVQKQNMNTLAVNKLLKKLEAAIASGNHQQASIFAKELAELKIQCSVIRQRSINNTREININMYIEDKEGHQGPIPLLLPLNMTVAQLKAKISLEFEIPTNIQRWIIGKNLAENENSTLEELQTTESIFLYLVAPEITSADVSQPEKSNVVEEIEKLNIKKVEILPETVITVDETEEKKYEGNPGISFKHIKTEKNSEEIKLKRYEELMSLENRDLIPNSEPFDCPICFVTYAPEEGVTLRDCLHTFCRLCVTNTIVYCEEAEVQCPYRDAVYTCESTLQEREIKALVAPKVYQQHLSKSIAEAENNAGNAFHCKTPNCPGWCIYDDNVNNFFCPVCHNNNCLTCQVIHMGKNCRQYQDELRLSKETNEESERTEAVLEEMVNRGEALPCPTCAVIVMKKWGCDWLRCSICKTEICWVTKGPRWGPAGKGDTSGGCKCGENGVKCHPRCNYCH